MMQTVSRKLESDENKYDVLLRRQETTFYSKGANENWEALPWFIDLFIWRIVYARWKSSVARIQ